MANSRTARKKLSTGKKIVLTIVTMLVVLLVSGGVYAYSLYKKLDQTYQPLNRDKSEVREEKVDINKKEAVSVLLLGIDKDENRKGDKGRSDTLILLTVNPADNTSKMVSIPRDSYVEIVGKGFEDKINHAYAFGGVEMAVNTVEKFLNVPVDYYAAVDMDGLTSAVDLVGGIEVENEFAFTYGGTKFSKGAITLTGKDVMNYVRMRYDDPNGDFGRQARQRQVLQKLAEKALTITSVTKLHNYMDVLGENVTTNIAATEMITMIPNYAPSVGQTDTLYLEGVGAKRNSIYYYDINETSRQDVSKELRTHLGLE